jgi:hypothetical protein
MNIWDLLCHGLRAKDRSFNASFKTNLDKIYLDRGSTSRIWRVILNLINNAF